MRVRVSRATSAAVRSMSTDASRYSAVYEASMHDPAAFWRRAAEDIHWHEQPKHTLQKNSTAYGYSWFPGGKLNTTYNALDRHVASGRGNQIALQYHSAVLGQTRALTYSQLLSDVEAAAGMLRAMGVTTGDRVVIYMPVTLEGVIAMLACARIGAVHSVVFGGFAPHELAVRIDDAKPAAILTSSCGLEGKDKVVHYEPLLQAALRLAKHKVKSIVMVSRPQSPVATGKGTHYVDWYDEIDRIKRHRLGADPVFVPSEHPSYVLYTSGTTGAPKGVVRDTGGHATALQWSMREVYGVQPGEVWWAASDIGWVVGHSWIAYGPLINGCTSVLFEGKPVGTPDAAAYWRVIDQHNVSAMFTAPTAIRAIKKEDAEGTLIKNFSLKSLKTLFLAGERSDPATVDWATQHLKVPVVDNYWQTEFGWPVISNSRGLGLLPVPPGSAGRPVPGWDVRVLSPKAAQGNESEYFSVRTDKQLHVPGDHGPQKHSAELQAAKGDRHHSNLHPAPFLPEATANELGPLVLRLPLPPGSLLSLTDEARFKRSYLDPYPGYFTTGDAAYEDENGCIHIMARADDVMNVAGHRLSSGAMEAAISTLPCVAECAVVGPADALKGQVPLALIVVKNGVNMTEEQVVKEAVAVVRKEIGPVAAFRAAVVVKRLPKTRSGKVLRATVKAIADGEEYKVPATIDDPAILPEIEADLKRIGYAVKKSQQ